MKIGIGITTYDRRDVAKRTVAEIKRLTPEADRIIVVDDASIVPYRNADYRFSNNVGIATAKNKCLELLDDCDNIFLFDDDCYPLVHEWWKPYVQNPEPHLMYLFSRYPGANSKIIYRDDRVCAYLEPRGCMLYIEKSVLNTVGGFYTGFPRWGSEHVEFSNRVHNAGLTKFPYQDVRGSKQLIHSGDEALAVQSSVPASARARFVPIAGRILEERKGSTEYVPYRDYAPAER